MPKSIVFFASRSEALTAAEAKGGITGGLFVVPAEDHHGKFVIERRDEDDGELLGYL